MRLVVINDNCLFRGEGRGDSTGDRGVHGGDVNNVWSKDGMREVGNARLKRRISRLE